MNESLIKYSTQIQANSTAALIEMNAMIAENNHRERNNLAYTYNEKDFMDLISRYSLDYNSVAGLLHHHC